MLTIDEYEAERIAAIRRTWPIIRKIIDDAVNKVTTPDSTEDAALIDKMDEGLSLLATATVEGHWRRSEGRIIFWDTLLHAADSIILRGD